MQFISVMQQSILFTGLSREELEDVLDCLGASFSTYEKGAWIFRAGEQTEVFGLLLDGSAHIVQEDFWGNRTIVSEAGPGRLFAEAFACTKAPLTVSVVADTPATVLFVKADRILMTCPCACAFHSRVIHNLLLGVAQNNLRLNEKLTHTSKRTTKEKLLSYLSAQSLRGARPDFVIPYNRQQLADYLCVDRSAMSKALCDLRDEGVLRFHRDHFTLLSDPQV